MNTISIKGQLREIGKKKTTLEARRNGFVPGVIYGGEKELHFIVSQKDLKPVVFTSEFMKIRLEIEGKRYECIVKDLQFHKVTDELIHIDLLELVEKKPIKAEIPLKLVGNAEGVKEGGKLIFKLKAVKVLTTPEKLQESIEVDISSLGIGENIRVKDISVDGIKILNSEKVPVVGIAITRALKQEAAAEPAGKGGATSKKEEAKSAASKA